MRALTKRRFFFLSFFFFLLVFSSCFATLQHALHAARTVPTALSYQTMSSKKRWSMVLIVTWKEHLWIGSRELNLQRIEVRPARDRSAVAAFFWADLGRPWRMHSSFHMCAHKHKHTLT